MTPKEKAEQLVKKYIELLKKTDTCLIDPCPNMIMCQHSWHMCEGWLSYAKQCALLTVDEIMFYDLMEYPQHNMIYAPHKNDYWQQVKQEIEQL